MKTWLVSTWYGLKARALHAVGLHIYRMRWTGPLPRHSNRCIWCGSVDPRCVRQPDDVYVRER